MGPAWVPCPHRNGLNSIILNWRQLWHHGALPGHLGITTVLGPAPTLQPCPGDHQNIPTAKTGQAESRGWGLHLAFPVPLVGLSCPALSAMGQAAQNQSSAHSAAPREGLQITRSISKEEEGGNTVIQPYRLYWHPHTPCTHSQGHPTVMLPMPQSPWGGVGPQGHQTKGHRVQPPPFRPWGPFPLRKGYFHAFSPQEITEIA